MRYKSFITLNILTSPLLNIIIHFKIDSGSEKGAYVLGFEDSTSGKTYLTVRFTDKSTGSLLPYTGALANKNRLKIKKEIHPGN